MEIEDLLRSIKTTQFAPTDEELRSLPHRKAFIYGRVSTQEQVRGSRESVMEIGKLLLLAKQDGHSTSLEAQQVEQWLKAIQNGENVPRVLEDGDLVINCQDLGLSGSLGEDKRPGLGDLWRRVECGVAGAIYLTEGMSRLSRDKDRVLGYKLLRLLKQHQCRIRTPEGVYNPAISRDWEYLADDIEDAADEMKKLGIRLHRRRASKAAQGKHVGSVVCPGFIVHIEGRNSDDSLILGKWITYAPHQEIVVAALKELGRQRSVFRAVRVLHAAGIVFPFFPDELKYMKTRSALRLYPTTDKGYLITTNTLKTLATNLALIGIWHWKDTLIENNHPAIVPLDLFLQAYEIATSHKPRGRAAYAEVMEWADLLYCYNHERPLKIAAYNTSKRWACCQHHHLGLGPSCLYIEDHLLTLPLTREFLGCLDLTPHAEAVLEKLKSEVSEKSFEERRYRQRETELKEHIANLKRYLGSDDPEREEIYWSLIKEASTELQMIQQRPPAPSSTVMDLEKVRQFLDNLEESWEKYPSRMRNHLLKALVSRVELRHDRRHIEATIVWKMGLRQVINIQRHWPHCSLENRWSAQETKLLRVLWPSASWETILAALPRRNKSAVRNTATRLRLSRQGIKRDPGKSIIWTPAEVKQLKEFYTKQGLGIMEIAAQLGRTEMAVEAKICALKIKRPKELYHKKREPAWQGEGIKVIQAMSSQKHAPR